MNLLLLIDYKFYGLCLNAVDGDKIPATSLAGKSGNTFPKG
jgi:hypothetical protein